MTRNKVDIQDVLVAVQETSPLPNLTKVTWEYPGYIHVAFPHGANPNFYVALGTHLGRDYGYSWNDEDGTLAGEIDDLNTPKAVAQVFWIGVLDALNLIPA